MNEVTSTGKILRDKEKKIEGKKEKKMLKYLSERTMFSALFVCFLDFS